MIALDAGDRLVCPGVYLAAQLTKSGYQGTVRLSDLALFARVAARLPFPVVLTSLSKEVMNGKAHHSRLGTYDVRVRGLYPTEITRLADALNSEGFDVHPEPDAPLGPHLHVTRR